MKCHTRVVAAPELKMSLQWLQKAIALDSCVFFFFCFSEDKDSVDWDDLSKLTYLTMFIRESLRTHSPVQWISRQTTQPHTLPDGRSIPSGTIIGIVSRACHMDPKHWPDPDRFDPERFSTEASKGRHPYAFIPFSAGPRNCIGQNFAMNEMKSSVALILKRFKLFVDEDRDKPREEHVLVLKSGNGVWLKLKPVSS